MRVLLADDHALFREGIRLVLESLVDGGVEVVEAGDYHQALTLVRTDPRIEIGFLDLNMPGMDGFLGIESLKRAAPDVHLVVISASTEPYDVRHALDAGASGYIAKSSPSTAMIEAIRSVLAGDTYLSPELDPVPAAGQLRRADGIDLHDLLTPRQRDVLAMLRQGKSNKEIAREMHLAEITVKLHVTAILRALGVENRTQAAILAAKLGVCTP
ncbi:MAG: response regulator transcription factor [Magnetospirillum sp.]|nr:response regulator transcription factor [Magnetospirillum sp.]